MKLRLLIQIAVVVSIVLLCTGFGVYSFLRLNSVENRQDFNLYRKILPFVLGGYAIIYVIGVLVPLLRFVVAMMDYFARARV